jgi:hypothetical protein
MISRALLVGALQITDRNPIASYRARQTFPSVASMWVESQVYQCDYFLRSSSYGVPFGSETFSVWTLTLIREPHVPGDTAFSSSGVIPATKQPIFHHQSCKRKC